MFRVHPVPLRVHLCLALALTTALSGMPAPRQLAYLIQVKLVS